MTETTRPTNDTPQSLYLNMAMDLGDEGWKLGFSTGLGQEPRLRSMKARDLTVLMKRSGWPRNGLGYPRIHRYAAVMRPGGTAFGSTAIC